MEPRFRKDWNVASTVPDWGATIYLCRCDSLCMTYAGMFAWRWRASTNPGRAANRAMRDLNHRLAAGPQASPDPSSSLCFNPAGSAARQDTNAAQGRTRTRLLRRLHEYQAVFCHKANIGRAVSMKPPITAASSMPPYHVNRDILLPEQQVDCRAMGHVIQFVDIRVGRSPVRVAGLAENRRLEWRGGV